MHDGRLIPFITDQRYNEYLKDLFKVVGLVRSLIRQNPTTRVQENVRLCDIARSHMARRSFVGNMFGKVDSAIIASMSGQLYLNCISINFYRIIKVYQFYLHCISSVGADLIQSALRSNDQNIYALFRKSEISYDPFFINNYDI